MECNCRGFGAGDLRGLLYAAACPVHCVAVFGTPEPKPLGRKVERCGDCRLWMTRQCPREANVNGWNKGPSMSAAICDKFQGAGQ